jgi:hypothetical protein
MACITGLLARIKVLRHWQDKLTIFSQSSTVIVQFVSIVTANRSAITLPVSQPFLMRY